MIGNLRCCNNIQWGNKDLCHCSMDVSWLHDIVPNKIKSNLNCHWQLTCDDWGILNTKQMCYWCTSAALLCCKDTQLFDCVWQIITHNWRIYIVLFIPRCYKTSFSSVFFCAFGIWSLSRPNRIWQQCYTREVWVTRVVAAMRCLRFALFLWFYPQATRSHACRAWHYTFRKLNKNHFSVCVLKIFTVSYHYHNQHLKKCRYRE